MVTVDNASLNGSGTIDANNMGTSRKQYQVIEVTGNTGDILTLIHSPEPEHLRTARVYNKATKKLVAAFIDMTCTSDEQTDIVIPITGPCSVIFEF